MSDVPHVFLPYQQRWMADANPVKVIEKSRRVGLSWAEAADSVLLAAQAEGMDTWYIGYNREMAQEFIRDCGDWARQFQTAAESMGEELLPDADGKTILAYVIRFASGFRITALSSRPSNLRGKQGRVIIDEAAFHPELGELLKAALALLIWGGQVHVISTHNGTENRFNQLVEEIRAGKKKYALHRVTLDDALADGLFHRICAVRGMPWSAEAEAEWRADLVNRYGDGAEEELFCVPSKGTGAWLTRTLIEERMTVGADRVLRYKGEPGMELWDDAAIEAAVGVFLATAVQPHLTALDPAARSYAGMDFGRHVDLSVVAPCQLGTNLARRFPFLIEMSNVPFKAQALVVFFVFDALPRFSHAMLDAGGNGAYLAEVAAQRYGLDRITGVKFSEGWYRDNTAPMKAAFEDGSIALPRDAAVLDDLAAFKMVRGVPRLPDLRVKDASGQQRHGDAGIAILLGHAASRSEGAYQPFTYEAVRPGGGREARSSLGAPRHADGGGRGGGRFVGRGVL